MPALDFETNWQLSHLSHLWDRRATLDQTGRFMFSNSTYNDLYIKSADARADHFSRFGLAANSNFTDEHVKLARTRNSFRADYFEKIMNYAQLLELQAKQLRK